MARLNRRLRGWANYFCLGPVQQSLSCRRSLHHGTGSAGGCVAKHKVAGSGYARYSDQYLYHELGLVRLPQADRNLPWAKA